MKKITKEMKMKQELKAWKETAEVLADKEVMHSIRKSLEQIASGKAIPASQL